MSLKTLLGLCALLWAVPGLALTLTQNDNIAEGRASFGPAATLFNWANFHPLTTWSCGLLPPQFSEGESATDPVTGSTVTAPPGIVISLGNWIDGDGFDLGGIVCDGPGGPAAPDLAFGGVEDFSLQFVNAVNRVGFAVATGVGNLSSEFDHSGAVFLVTTDTGEQGTLTLPPDPGQGYTAWVTIAADTPFQTLTFDELFSNNRDQYFGNVFASATPGEAANLQVTSHDPLTGELNLSYVPACAASSHDIYYGPLSDVATYGWSGSTCDIGDTGQYAGFNPGEGSYFFVIVGNADAVEGSYGTDNLGAERPAVGASYCGREQELATACP